MKPASRFIFGREKKIFSVYFLIGDKFFMKDKIFYDLCNIALKCTIKKDICLVFVYIFQTGYTGQRVHKKLDELSVDKHFGE